MLREDGDCRRYWISRVVSLAGDWVTYVVLPVLVYRISGSPFVTAVTSGLAAVAYLVFGLLAGALSDRLDRRRVMVACDALAAVVVGSVPVVALLGHLWMVHLLFVALAVQVADTFFDVGVAVLCAPHRLGAGALVLFRLSGPRDAPGVAASPDPSGDAGKRRPVGGRCRDDRVVGRSRRRPGLVRRLDGGLSRAGVRPAGGHPRAAARACQHRGADAVVGDRRHLRRDGSGSAVRGGWGASDNRGRGLLRVAGRHGGVDLAPSSGDRTP
jgi:hypothetical protein